MNRRKASRSKRLEIWAQYPTHCPVCGVRLNRTAVAYSLEMFKEWVHFSGKSQEAICWGLWVDGPYWFIHFRPDYGGENFVRLKELPAALAVEPDTLIGSVLK